MKFEDIIRERLTKRLGEQHFQLENVSHMHEGHAGDDGTGQTHFEITVSESAIKDKSRLAYHRMVNELLSDLYAQGLHSVSLKRN